MAVCLTGFFRDGGLADIVYTKRDWAYNCRFFTLCFCVQCSWEIILRHKVFEFSSVESTETHIDHSWLVSWFVRDLSVKVSKADCILNTPIFLLWLIMQPPNRSLDGYQHIVSETLCPAVEISKTRLQSHNVKKDAVLQLSLPLSYQKTVEGKSVTLLCCTPFASKPMQFVELFPLHVDFADRSKFALLEQRRWFEACSKCRGRRSTWTSTRPQFHFSPTTISMYVISHLPLQVSFPSTDDVAKPSHRWQMNTSSFTTNTRAIWWSEIVGLGTATLLVAVYRWELASIKWWFCCGCWYQVKYVWPVQFEGAGLIAHIKDSIKRLDLGHVVDMALENGI